MVNWQETLLDRVEGLVWAQWITVGAALTGKPCRLSVVDPEGLVIASCSLGRFNPRLFDESLDWSAANYGLLKTSRLRLIAGEYDDETRRALAAYAECLSKAAGTEVMGKLKESVRFNGGSKKTAFWLHNKDASRTAEDADETFLHMGFVRGTPRLRKHSGKPDPVNQANLMFKLRQKYGKGARADCVTYLVAGGRGSSNAIAGKIKYRQPSVYKALEQLVNAGVVNKYGQAGWADYWIDASETTDLLGKQDSKPPVFFVWPDIYRAFYLVLRDFAENGEMDGSSLKSIERARELTVAVVSLIRNAGEPLAQQAMPDIRKSAGSANIEELQKFLGSTMEILDRFITEEKTELPGDF